MNLNKAFQDFEGMYGLKTVKPTMDNLTIARHLIEDEVTELDEEIHVEPDLKRVAKEMTDIIYITGERMTNLGFDVDALFQEVHRSNMSKRVHVDRAAFELSIARQRYPRTRLIQLEQTDYLVMKDDATGKVVKPTSYSPAQITLEMLRYE